MEDVVAKLTIIKVIQHKTPQSGTWLHCFSANSGQASGTANKPNQQFSGTDAEVALDLVLDPVILGDPCRFHIGLDDDQADVCSPQAEDQSDGQFAVTSTGSQLFNAGDDWAYTVFWKASGTAPARVRKGKDN
jgi:hypothetical protein